VGKVIDTLPAEDGEILASRVFIGLVFTALLGSHLIPFHLRSRGCATTPLTLSLQEGLRIITLKKKDYYSNLSTPSIPPLKQGLSGDFFVNNDQKSH